MVEKYLDKAGVQQLWNKVKEQIANSSGGSDGSVNVITLNSGFTYENGAVTTFTGSEASTLYDLFINKRLDKPSIFRDYNALTYLFPTYSESTGDFCVFTITYDGILYVFTPGNISETKAEFICKEIPLKQGKFIEEGGIVVSADGDGISYDTSHIISGKIFIRAYDDEGYASLTISTGEGDHPIKLNLLDWGDSNALIEIDRVGDSTYYNQLIRITHETPNGFETETFRTDTGIWLLLEAPTTSCTASLRCTLVKDE